MKSGSSFSFKIFVEFFVFEVTNKSVF